ncbi:hypothetical protein PIB30_049833 [Stylosanthes scabra]|uniref:Uncharacterized protein n=1 Tax=Stylosanthes scabra TaxID=79078 RepID=A0ABU6XF61_9FABA|nr:hypothetical protein [Stylosanthes scabra]
MGEENEFVRGRRDPSGLFDVEIVCVCSVFVVGNKVQHGEENDSDLTRFRLGATHGWIRDDLWKRLVEFWRQEDYKKLKQTNKRNRTSETGGSLQTGGSTTYEATRERMAECQAIIDAGGPKPPPIDEDALWAQFAGGRKKGRIYGKGVVPSHKYPPLFGDPDDDDTATGPPNLKEQVVLLNRELSQQAETNAQKVRSLESTVQAQSQEVSDLRKAYSDMYSYLSQIQSGLSASGMPDLPPPPPPPARYQDPPPEPEQSTGSPQSQDDPNYV